MTKQNGALRSDQTTEEGIRVGCNVSCSKADHHLSTAHSHDYSAMSRMCTLSKGAELAFLGLKIVSQYYEVSDAEHCTYSSCIVIPIFCMYIRTYNEHTIVTVQYSKAGGL